MCHLQTEVSFEPPKTASSVSGATHLITRPREQLKFKSDFKYSQTSVFEHNPFQKAVRKVICSKSETIFPIKINANNFNPFQL